MIHRTLEYIISNCCSVNKLQRSFVEVKRCCKASAARVFMCKTGNRNIIWSRGVSAVIYFPEVCLFSIHFNIYLPYHKKWRCARSSQAGSYITTAVAMWWHHFATVDDITLQHLMTSFWMTCILWILNKKGKKDHWLKSRQNLWKIMTNLNQLEYTGTCSGSNLYTNFYRSSLDLDLDFV